MKADNYNIDENIDDVGPDGVQAMPVDVQTSTLMDKLKYKSM